MFNEYPELKKVINNYYSEIEKVQNEYQKKQDSVYNSREQKKEALAKVKDQAQQVQNKFKQKLEKKFNSKVDEIKSKVGFGEGDPAATQAELSMLDDLNKTELSTVIDKYQQQNNYLGLKKASKAAFEKNVPVDFTDVETEIEQLEKYYRGKQRRFGKNPLNDNDNSMIKKGMGV